MPSFAASKARLPEDLVATVFQLALNWLDSSSDRVVTRVQFTLGERHSIILFVRAELAWFHGGRASSPTKHTSKVHRSPTRYCPGYEAPDLSMNCFWGPSPIHYL